MPVILPGEKENDWIGENSDKSEIELLLKPYPENEMIAHTVSRRISARNVDINDPGLIEFYEYNIQGLV